VETSELLNHLAHFTGSEAFTRHPLIPRVLMTEGVVFLANQGGAHWLTDAIASYLCNVTALRVPFQVWRLVVDGSTRRAELTMTDGTSRTPLITQTLDYTDFPLREIELWLVAGPDHWVLILPAEY